VITELGGFGGMYGLDLKKYNEPVLVAATDGVGTKLKLAFLTDKHDTIGIDLVAMCVNDLVTLGANPLFFLDYLATGELNIDQFKSVVTGIVEGCRKAGCALLGGETAEMPDFYKKGEYDTAGFAVGILDRSDVIDGSNIKEDDIVITSGFSNNYPKGLPIGKVVSVSPDNYGLSQKAELELFSSIKTTEEVLIITNF
jgi:phosphoribosylformylglycinamidine cyclo-ligase